MRILLSLMLLLGAPASTMAQDSARPRVVEVRLTNFDFTPRTIRLHAGQPVVLRLVNASGGGHNFAAPAFFEASRVTDRGALRDGRIEVPSRQTRSVGLVPARGTYRLRCTHTLHSPLGMRGRIVVE